MTDLLSISEYSKIRGCSVSAVYKRLKSPSNRIHQYVVRQDNQIFIKAEILETEELRSDPPGSPPRSDRKIEDSKTPLKPVEEVEEVEEGAVEEGIGAKALRILEQQLLQKDKEIADLNRRLEESERHEREMSKTIAELAAQANELHRNNQILMLAQTQQQQLEAAPEIQDPIDEEPVIQEDKKPGFWQRVFGSRRKDK